MVTGCAVTAVAACFGFSYGNVLALGRSLGAPEWVARLLAPAVDASVVGLIVGVRHLSLAGVPARRLRPARLMLVVAGLATWALNVAQALLLRRDLGAAAYDSIAPLLLVGWAEIGPWFLRQFRTLPAAGEVAATSGIDLARPAGTAPAGEVPVVGNLDPLARPASPSAVGAAAAAFRPPAASGLMRVPAAGGPADHGPGPAAAADPAGDAELRAAARRLFQANPRLSGAELARLIGRSDSYARRLLRQFRLDATQSSGRPIRRAGRPGSAVTTQVPALPVATPVPTGDGSGSPAGDGQRG
jgi:hypothetical protein